MKTVLRLKAQYANQQPGFVYVQQVTSKTVVTVHDEDTTVYWDRSTGRCRTNSDLQILNLDSIEKFMKQYFATKWHGNWKPKHNSRGELVDYKMPKASDFKSLGDWFRAQNVKIIPVESEIKPRRTPHPFEYRGTVYYGPVRVKVLDSDTNESLQQRIDEAVAKFKTEHPNYYSPNIRQRAEEACKTPSDNLRSFYCAGHDTEGERKARERRKTRERRGF